MRWPIYITFLVFIVSLSHYSLAANIFSDGFEGCFSCFWTSSDANAASGSDTWKDVSGKSFSGSWSAFSAGTGDNSVYGGTNIAANSYDNDMQSIMYRTVGLSSYSSVTLNYKYWIVSESCCDRLYAAYYSGGSWTYVDVHNGNSNGWQSSSVSIPTTATNVGFYFYSDFSNVDQGAYVDDVSLDGTVAGDTNSPSAGSISINSGAAYTTSTSVTLTLSCTDNVACTNMRFANSADCSSAAWEAYSTSKSWTLDSGDGSKTVCAQFKDAAGNLGSMYTDSITLDGTAPVISGGSPSGVVNSGTITMSVTTNENANCKYSTTAGTAYGSMESTFSTTGGTSHSTSLGSLGSGSHNRYVRCMDTAGNPDASDYTVSFTANDAPVIATNELRSTIDSKNILLNPDIASGNSLNVYVSATDDRGIDYIQYIDQSGSPSELLSCVSGGVYPTSCTKTFTTITPTTASHSYNIIVHDKDGRNALATIGPINVINACADWYYTAGVHTPSISGGATGEYVNYANCQLKDAVGSLISFDCGAGNAVRIVHQGQTEATNDYANICGTIKFGTWASTTTSCGTQTATVTFTSDYSLNGRSTGYTGVQITGVGCYSTDGTAPTTTDNTKNPGYVSWHSADFPVTLTCTDNAGGSGCDKTYYCIDTSGPVDCDPTTLGASLTMIQTGYVRYYSTDVAGNTEKNVGGAGAGIKQSEFIGIDKNDPTSIFLDSTTMPTGVTPIDGSWVNKNGFTITVKDEDTGGSNLKDCKYRICSNVGGGTCNGQIDGPMVGTCSGVLSTVTKSISVGSSGDCKDQGTDQCQVQSYAVDNANRQNGVAYRTYKVDYTDPITFAKVFGTSAETFDVTWPTSADYPSPGASGLKQIDFDVNINGGGWSSWASCQTALPCWTAGKLSYTGTVENMYAFRARGTDVAGNVESAHASADSTTKIVNLPSSPSIADNGNIISLTPTLTWTASTGANSYAVQICTDDTCATKVITDTCVTGTSYTVGSDVLSWQNTYTWKIWASADNCASYRSPAVWHFNVKLPAPLVNTPPSPVDGGTTSPTPTLEWQRSGNANYYKIEFETPAEAKRTNYKSSVSDPASYTVSPGLSQSKTYTWRIFASNDNGGTYSPFVSPDRTFTTAGICSGLPVAAVCDEYPIEAVGTNQMTWTTPQVDASMITTSSPSYWRVTLPAMYQQYSPVPGDDGRRSVGSYDFGVTAKIQSGTITPTVKIGTTAGGSDVCAGGFSCSNGVTPGAYYIKIEAASGSGNVYPEISYKISFCGIGAPIADTVADSDSVDVGGCTVTIKHLASDAPPPGGDGSTGRFTDLGLTNNNGYWDVLHQTVAARQRTMEFDDAPSGGCDMDLKFNNEWIVNGDGSSPHTIKIFNMKLDKNAGHVLSYGYRLESSNCVFTPASTGTCFDDPNVAGNDCANTPAYDANKQGVTWIQNVGTNGAPPPDSNRAQNVEYYNVNECNPSDNTNAAGYNDFCAMKDPDGAGPLPVGNNPYCDPVLRKCTSCSIVNNNPATSGNPNALDCPAGSTAKGWTDNPADPNDQLIVGKCNLLAGATKGGNCQYFTSCTFNTDCSTACCSRESTINTGNPGPGEGTGKCITPFSAGNPINPYLCRA